MKGDEKNGKKQRKKSVIFILVIALLFSLLIVLTAVLVRVKNISVSGSRYYDSEAVRRLIFPEDSPRLYTVLKAKYLMPGSVRKLFKSCRLKMPDLRSVTIEIEEQDGFVILKTQSGSYLRLQEDGTVLGIGTERDSRLPMIEGVAVKGGTLFQKTVPEKEGLLTDALYYVKLIKSTEIPFDTLEYTEESGFFFRAEGVKVLLGSVENADEKVDLASDQYPEIRTLSGTLHLEKYTSKDGNVKVYFKVGEE